jgi:hypothetical protein
LLAQLCVVRLHIPSSCASKQQHARALLLLFLAKGKECGMEKSVAWSEEEAAASAHVNKVLNHLPLSSFFSY